MVSSIVVEQYDWATEVQKFDDSKSGVKGLVDAGVQKIPKFFVHPPESSDGPEPVKPSDHDLQVNLPVIDFEGAFEVGSARRKEVVEEISKAAHEWGFFQIVNHGVSLETMDAMLDAVKRFHEQPTEEKEEFYSGDVKKMVKFMSNQALENHPATWRDILACTFVDDQVYPEQLPTCSRDEILEYQKRVIQLRELMAELFSEALGLNSDYLSKIECMKSQSLACLYYPACPEPEKTYGRGRHSDTTFLTLLMQDSLGGLQIVHDNQWMNVPPKHGAFIVNIGDALQIISNDKFRSVQHRVLSQPIGPRISVACFFSPSRQAVGKPFAPLKEILSDENPALYREFMFAEYVKHYKENGEGAISALDHVRIR